MCFINLCLFCQLQVDPHHQDAYYLHSRIHPAREQVIYVQNAVVNDDHHQVIEMVTQLLEISPWAREFRETRSDSYIATGDILAAISDLRSVNRLTQDSTDGYFKISNLLYQLGHASDALKEIRECLKLDPEHKNCFPYYKTVKKVEKALTDAQEYLENKEYDECIRSCERVLKFESDVPMIVFSAKQLSCTCHVKAEKYSAAIGQCREALELHKDPSVLCDRAEAYVETDMFDEGKLRFEARRIAKRQTFMWYFHSTFSYSRLSSRA